MIRLVSQGRVRLLIAIVTMVLGALFPLSTSFAAGPQQVNLKAGDFYFKPDSVTLTVGQPVQLTIVNEGKLDHDLKSDIPIANLSYQKADNPADEQKDNVAKGILDVDYGKGITAQVTFTPTKAGTYEFHCDIPGHTEAGMKGTFIVTAAGNQDVAAKQVAPTALPKTGGPLGANDLPWLAGVALLVVGAALGGREVAQRPRRS